MKLNQHAQDELKKAVGKKAATLVEEGMLVGLGTGSTASCFIESLIERCRAGLKITAVSSSVRSLEMAKAGGISVLSMDDVTDIDLTIDGADEVDPKFRLIKGGGGALLREKIIASTSKQIVIIIDESKLVDALGKFGLPVEIIPFGYKATISKINRAGYEGILRMKQDGSVYLTDNGNFIYDIHGSRQFYRPEEDHDKINNIPGVVETGLFFNLPVRVLAGRKNGNVDFVHKE
ncbi:MAG: ribose-5-phosphate isomerase RpiA [Chlamydiales bacterium]|nr:ribose-5-phosphate isomerase RpiA [Chlamydiales bacterium]